MTAIQIAAIFFVVSLLIIVVVLMALFWASREIDQLVRREMADRQPTTRT